MQTRIITTLPTTELEVADGNYDTSRAPIDRIILCKAACYGVMLGVATFTVGVVLQMLKVISAQLKVFRSIVISDMVNVMHFFFWAEVSANDFLHDKTMLIHIALLGSKGVVPHQEKHIALVMPSYTASPNRTVGSYMGLVIALLASLRGIRTKLLFTGNTFRFTTFPFHRMIIHQWFMYFNYAI